MRYQWLFFNSREIEMKKFVFSISALVLGIFALSAPAQAQASRTWVSGVGDDVNPCSRTAPCKTFPGAISKTAANGEINCLDPGGFGTVTITKSISIVCDFTEGGVLSANVNGIIVNLPTASDRVVLSGLDIEGFNTGIDGIRVIGLGTTIIRKTLIRNVTGKCVDLIGGAGARVYLQDSQLVNCAGGGFFLQGAAGVTNNAVIERNTFDLNGGAAVNIVGPGQAILSGNTLAFSNPSVQSSNGAVVISYTNNIFRNSSAGVTSTIPLQ